MEYDNILGLYQESKDLPYRQYIEKYSLFRMCGSLKGKKVLDLACGNGDYTRESLDRNAEFALGLDINPKSIELAKKLADDERLSYQVQDIRHLETLDQFDIAIGAYLLNHAQSKEELAQFVKGIYKNLKPGGKFIGINDNPGNAPEFYKKYKKYGFLKSGSKQRQEGDPITYTFFNEDGSSFSLDNYYLSLQTYEEVFLEAGFQSFYWKTLKISEKSKEKYSLDFWRTFLNHPPIIGIEAIK